MIRTLAALALLPAAALAAPGDSGPRITVTAAGTARTPPDLAVIRYVVRGEGATADEATRALVERRRAIDAGLRGLQALRDAGSATTSRVAIAEVRGRECQTYQPQLSVGACAILGYRASLDVELRTRAVAQAGTIVGLVGRGGGTEPQITSFALADDMAARARATAEAFANARARAEALAAAGHVRLGRLLLATDGSSSRAEADDAPDDIAPPAPPPPPPPPPPPVAIELKPRPIETEARVTLVFEAVP